MEDLKNITIGSHALMRFKQRWKKAFGRRPKRPKKKIRKLLLVAEEAKVSKKFKILETDKWIFVLDISLLKIRTIILK